MYFEGKLIEPTFAVGRSRTRLGSLSWKVRSRHLFGVKFDYTIRLSNYYDLEERDFKSVLLHEMIHLYIESQHLKDTSSHGVIFRRIMQIINKDGWNIRVASKIDETKQAQTAKRKRSRVVMAVTITNGEHLFSVVNPHYAREINKRVAGSRGIKDVSWYVSDDDYFATFAAVRTPKGRVVSDEVFNEMTAAMQPFEL